MSDDLQAVKVASIQSHISEWLDLLAVPGGLNALELNGEWLISKQQGVKFPVSGRGIALFAEQTLTKEADQQQRHYDRIAEAYAANLSYPHTQEYSAYLDSILMAQLGQESLGVVAELCCGHGEALGLSDLRFDRYVGIDISAKMLEGGLAHTAGRKALFAQGDATCTPLKDGSIDTVLMLGGVHHVPDRLALFREIKRILRPGGRFVFREPVSDFFVWKAIRSVVYRMSPMLNHDTERPLTYPETEPALRAAGLSLSSYRTCGFIGFCLLMNSDVLVFNRLFRHIPGIRSLTRAAARFDDVILRLPILQRAGLQVVGEARIATAR